jgi:sugar fermentation stimulation protein A
MLFSIYKTLIGHKYLFVKNIKGLIKMQLFNNNRVEGKFISRINRFIAEVEINRHIHLVHVPNTGRMKELLVKDAIVQMKYHPASHKKTDYSLISVKKNDISICVDSRVANQLFYDYLSHGKLEKFNNIRDLKREIKFNNSRFDIGFIQNNQPFLIEIKSVNLVKDQKAMFPDAPTIRGNKHIRELIEAKKQGFKTGIVFIIQRPDATLFLPYRDMDPDFSNSLVEAYSKGVFVKAFTCEVNNERIEIKKEIPILL